MFIEKFEYREKVKAELTKNWDFSRVSASCFPMQLTQQRGRTPPDPCPCCLQFSYPRLAKDGRWYWNYNSGLQAQYILFRSKTSELPKFDVDGDEGPEAHAEVFFDVRGDQH